MAKQTSRRRTSGMNPLSCPPNNSDALSLQSRLPQNSEARPQHQQPETAQLTSDPAAGGAPARAPLPANPQAWWADLAARRSPAAARAASQPMETNGEACA